MLACDIDQAVHVPTRVQGSASSILGLVFHSRSLRDVEITVEEGISDLRLVCFTCRRDNSVNNALKECKSVKNSAKANDESVIDYLELALDDFSSDDVDYLWLKLKSICHFCIDNFVLAK